MKTTWSKTHFLVYAAFVGNFSNKHNYNLPKFRRKNHFCYFCPKWLFPELFTLKNYVLLTSSRNNLNHDFLADF